MQKSFFVHMFVKSGSITSNETKLINDPFYI